MAEKPKVAFYWCASCGGCEESVVDLAEDILSVVENVDIVFWPVAMDFKKKDVEAMEDGSITACFLATSKLAIKLYCGLVEACMLKFSRKTCGSKSGSINPRTSAIGCRDWSAILESRCFSCSSRSRLLAFARR